MPKYTVNLTQDQVDAIREKAIKDMPSECPQDPKGFIEWILGQQTEGTKREKQMQRIGKMKADEIKEALDDWEKKPKEWE